MTRTDVHAPSNLKPEDYDFLGCGNYSTASLSGNSPLMTPYGQQLLSEGYHFAYTDSGGGCQHCGHSHLIYYAILIHKPTKTFLRVGERCLDNRFSLANAQFKTLRKQGRLNSERKRRDEKLAVWMATPDNAEAYVWASGQPAGDDWERTFEGKFVAYVDKHGEASENWVAAILRSKQRKAEWDAKRAEDAKTAKPVVEGRIAVIGRILSIKWKDSNYGGKFVMTVQDDRGFKVWGTVPASLENDLMARYHELKLAITYSSDDLAQGLRLLLNEEEQRVEFTATITKSDKDETFGFFKRPATTRRLASDAELELNEDDEKFMEEAM